MDAEKEAGTSQGSSDENEVPSHTSRWSIELVDKFGIRKEKTDPDKILKKWRICLVSESEAAAIDEIVDKTYLEGFDFNSLEDIPFHINIPFKTWGIKFEPRTIGVFKTFNENIEEFRFHLYNILRQMHVLKKRENQEPYEIGYQVLFEKLLRCVEFRMQSQLEVPRGQVKIFGQEVTSKADIVGLKCDDPSKILFICEVTRKCYSDENEYSPVKKKLRSSTDLEFAAEVTSSCSGSLDMPSNVYARHIGELLSYLECSVIADGLLGVVIQKTNVMFTYLKIDPESVEKIKGRKKPGSVKFETTRLEDPVFFYTKQFNLLKKKDRRTIFKTLVTIKMMEKKVCCTFS